MAAAAGADSEPMSAEERLIAEQYKVWKKNSVYLYDLVVTHALEWPSLTAQWLPDVTHVPGKEIDEYKMVLGTHTSEAEQNSLLIVKVRLPREDTKVDTLRRDAETGEYGGYSGMSAKVDVSIRINHEGEVNRARYCPQNPFLIATKTISGEVHVFDYSKHPSMPAADDFVARPDIRCKGHDKEGYGLSWSPLNKGHLLSGSDDHKVCLWDTYGARGDMPATQIFTGHSSVVEDVAWHRYHKDLFGSVGDDRLFLIWDTRKPTNKPAQTVAGHTAEINCVTFNPNNEFLVATGCGRSVYLWDLRNMKAPIHTLQGHQDEVFGAQWCPQHESVIASSGSDRRIIMWDLARVGAKQTAEAAAQGPPELMFIHGGHTSKVSDFSWNDKAPWVLASVAEDNILQIWQPAENVYNQPAGAANTAGGAAAPAAH